MLFPIPTVRFALEEDLSLLILVACDWYKVRFILESNIIKKYKNANFKGVNLLRPFH
jgi:hypothetical protein